VFVDSHPTNLKGSVAELKIAAEAARLGVSVLAPMTEHGRYDLAFEIDERLLRVQCKWAQRKGDVVIVNLSSYRLTTRGYVRRTYTVNEIDAVAAYCGELDSCYFLPVGLVAGMRAIQLRLHPPKNGQRAALNWASDYTLSGAIAQLGERGAGSAEGAGSSPAGSTENRAPTCRAVGAHEFRNHFGYYMELAAAGAEIHVTRRGKPYVRLLGHQPTLPG
jgi:prevent-host-death family protein